MATPSLDPAAANHPVAAAVAPQGWPLAYNDVYRVLAIVVLLLAPWCMLLKPTSVGATGKAVSE